MIIGLGGGCTGGGGGAGGAGGGGAGGHTAWECDEVEEV